jgi:uncharacterized cupin superfamily protein
MPLVETSHCNVDLKPSPIEPSWIIEGNPEARSHVLWTSADGAARTLIWSCSGGKFNWYYDFDETIVILEDRSCSRARACRRSAVASVTRSFSAKVRTPNGMSRAV